MHTLSLKSNYKYFHLSLFVSSQSTPFTVYLTSHKLILQTHTGFSTSVGGCPSLSLSLQLCLSHPLICTNISSFLCTNKMIHLFSVEKVLTLLAAIYPLIQLKERLQLDSFNVKFSRHFFEMFHLSSTNSVTRFGEISPLWQNFKSLWCYLRVYFVLG